LNPVWATLVDRAEDWTWFSVHAHLGRVGNDRVTVTAPVLKRYPDFAELLVAGEDAEMSLRLRKAETIGRPVGDEAFLNALERQSGRSLQPLKRGPRAELNALSP
jgi:putative transposase